MGSDRAIPWISVALIAVAAVWIMFRETPGLLDIALIFSCVMILVLLCPTNLDKPNNNEGFLQPAQVEDGLWAQALATKGALTTYVTTFRTDSYPTPSDTWLSVADEMMGTNGGKAAALASSSVACTPTTSANRDFKFNEVQPVRDANLGFALANVVVTGPMSMVILPPTFREFTVFCLFQLTGLSPVGTTSTLIFIPANSSPKQNGLNLAFGAVAGGGTGSSVTTTMTLTVGNQTSLVCSDNYVQGSTSNVSTVTFDTSARYLLMVTRSSLSVRVSLFNVEATSSLCTPNTIMAAPITDDALVYNNQAILINGSPWDLNGGGGIQGNLMTFGIFDAALNAPDEALVCTHYHNLLLNQSPAVQMALASAATATAALACPYDTTTCAACTSVTSWTSPFTIMNDGGAACLAAINTFCTNNPRNLGCECYNPANIATFTASTKNACLALQSAYSGNSAALCAVPIQLAVAEKEAANKAVADALAAALAEEQSLRDQIAAEVVVKPVAKKSFFAWLFGF